MKRSTKIFAGAAGMCLAAWGLETALRPPPRPLPPECVAGPDGRMPALPQCQRSSSRSSSSSSHRSSGGWSFGSSGGSDTSTSHGTPSHGPVVSRGGFGSTGHGFSSGS